MVSEAYMQAAGTVLVFAVGGIGAGQKELLRDGLRGLCLAQVSHHPKTLFLRNHFRDHC